MCQKVKKMSYIESPPLLSISVCSRIGIRASSFGNSLTTGRYILRAHMEMEYNIDTSESE
jgi:hypothetical protein